MKQENKKIENRIYMVLIIIVGAILAAFLILTLGFHMRRVSGVSMSPTLHDNALTVNEKVSEDTKINRGDIVTCQYGKITIIKRVIGLPGEWVYIENGKVWVDGYPVDEYAAEDWADGQTYDVTLGDDEYFLMGDNRNHSIDSRKFGPVKRSDILYLYKHTIFKGGSHDREKKD